jgi:hypothetical protein
MAWAIPLPLPTGANKHRFSPEEDEALRHLIGRFGTSDWTTVAHFMGGRSPRQCRHRYNNYLTGHHQPQAWTEAEDRIIVQQFRELGPKWAYISKLMTGRTGNDVKNRWHKHLSRKTDFGIVGGADQDHGPIHRAGEDESLMHTAIVVPEERRQAPTRPALSAFLQFALN